MFAPQKQKHLKSLWNWEEGREQQRLERDDVGGSEVVEEFLSLPSPGPHTVSDELALWKTRLRWSPEQLWSRLGESCRTHQGLCHTAAFSWACPSLCASVRKQEWRDFSNIRPLSRSPFPHSGATVLLGRPLDFTASFLWSRQHSRVLST